MMTLLTFNTDNRTNVHPTSRKLPIWSGVLLFPGLAVVNRDREARCVPVAVVKVALSFIWTHTPRLASVGVSRFVILACGVNGQPPLLGTLRSLNAADVGT